MNDPSPHLPAPEGLSTASESGRAELRDLGFRPYRGERLPPSHNGWVLFRYGLRRAWASLIVKIAALVAWGPALIALVAFTVVGFLAKQNPGQVPAPELASYARRLSSVQLWVFVTAVAVGAATSSIAEDRARGAFTFYFTKPLTQLQYLTGRAGASALVLTLVHALPCSTFVLLALGVAQGEPTESAARALCAVWATALVSAVAVTAVALAVSAVVQSSALAAAAFLALWVVPHFGTWLASVATDAPWLAFLSLPALLSTFSTPLFASDADTPWSHALGALLALAALSAACFAFCHARLVRESRYT